MLALLVAVCFALAWVLRLGWIADYFSRPVLLGYIHGVAVVLVIGQLGKLLGLSIDAARPTAAAVGGAPRARQRQRPDGRTGCGRARGAVRASRFSCPSCRPRSSSSSPRSGSRGRSTCRRTASQWSARFPPGCRASMCQARRGRTSSSLLPAAVGIFLVSFADEILTARSFAGKHSQHVRASQELLAMGAANAAAGVHPRLLGRRQRLAHRRERRHGRPQPGRRPRRGRHGARDPALPDRARAVPAESGAGRGDRLRGDRAGRAGGLAGARGRRPCRGRDRRRDDRLRRSSSACSRRSLVAVGLSIIDTVRRSARPHDAVLGWVERLGRYADVSLHRSARVTPGVVVYRLDDRLFFANARYFKGRVREAIRAASVARCPGSSSTPRRSRTPTRPGSTHSTDSRRSSAREEITLVVARLRTRMEDQFAAAGVTETIGRERFYPSVRAAVEACVPAQKAARSVE